MTLSYKSINNLKGLPYRISNINYTNSRKLYFKIDCCSIQEFCEEDGSAPELLQTGEANPLLWRCGAKATTKIENDSLNKPRTVFYDLQIPLGAGLAQKNKPFRAKIIGL